MEIDVNKQFDVNTGKFVPAEISIKTRYLTGSELDELVGDLTTTDLIDTIDRRACDDGQLMIKVYVTDKNWFDCITQGNADIRFGTSTLLKHILNYICKTVHDIEHTRSERLNILNDQLKDVIDTMIDTHEHNR